MRHRHSTDDRTCPGWRCIYVSDTFCGWSQVWRAVHAFTWYVQLKTISKVSKNKKCNCIWDEYSLRGIVNKLLSIDNPSNPSQALESVFDIWSTHTELWREIYSIHAICIWSFLVWLTLLILRSLYLGQPVLLEPTMSPLLNVRIAARHNTSGSGSSRHFLQFKIFIFFPLK